MKVKLISLLIFVSASLSFFNLYSQQKDTTKTNPPIYIAFQWHMHQPIYMPYESIITTANSGVYSFNLYDVFNERVGPYTSWPKDAVQKGINASLPHLGAQVSLSGSLIENLNNLEAAGACNGSFNNWKSNWTYITGQKTSLNNPRIDLVAFGYHHPLMGLIDYWDIRKAIEEHRELFSVNFPAYTYSKGIFPPENAFSVRMIPALVDEGIEWVMVDNFNFERASVGAPVGDGTSVLRPNPADILNPSPEDWTALNGLWCPAPVSAQWAHQPHYVQYIDPQTGTSKKIIAVPTSRYMGNEDGRGGFGALNYDYVMSQIESYNTDPDHPILIVLHHDGDNYGGGSSGYYGSNFQSFVDWLVSNPSRFVCTTIQDYLDMFPPDPTDIIHVQDGSWVGADAGDPEFRKWNGDPGTYMGTPNYSPDRNSWGIVTAAKNIVETANQVNPSSQSTINAWKYYLNSQTSCYWYWDGTEMWDSHPARACNLAVNEALNVLGGPYSDLTAPTIYLPQREPYNPGGIEWDAVGVMPSDFTVWTYVYDYSGLQSVKLKYRTVEEGTHTVTSTVTRTYAGGAGVTEWTEIDMTGVTVPSITNPMPLYKAQEFSAEITGMENILVSYYVEAVDSDGNIAKSPIQHVWVGDGNAGPGNNVYWEPLEPNLNEFITVTCENATSSSKLHWGVNNTGSTWQTPIEDYWPVNTVLFGSGPAVETPFTDPDEDGTYTVVIGPFNNASQVVNTVAFVIHHEGSWDNNGGNDYHITINNNPGEEPIGANNTVSTLMNTDYNFTTDDFYFVGMNGATFDGIKIVSSTSLGTLKYNGVPVVEGQDYSDVNSLVFSPAVGASGSPYTSFSFRVKDNNGLYSVATYAMTINVITQNPTSSNSSVNLLVDQTYTFSESNFPFDSPIDALFDGVHIISLPESGQLNYNGTPATVDVHYEDVSLLTYTPASGESGVPYSSFEFTVIDDGGLSSLNSYFMTINVIADIPDGVSWIPEEPTQYDMITIFVKNDASMSQDSRLHWGVNGWQMPIEQYRPDGSVLFNGTGPAIQTPFVDNGDYFSLNLGPFNSTQTVNTVDFALYYGNGTWNNNGDADWHININNIAANCEIEREENISIYPNPMTNFTFIEISDENQIYFDIHIFDNNGKIVKRDKIESNQKYIFYKNNLSQGIYNILFFNESLNLFYNKKLIIN